MIAEWRRKIDEIDSQLLTLLNQRAECALAIGKAKARERLPVHCPEREQAILARLDDQNRGPLDAKAVQRIFKVILSESRQVEAAVALAPRQKRSCPYRRIVIVGVGLMGGSLGLAIKRGFPEVEVIGVDQRETALQEAQGRGAIDQGLPLAKAVSEVDLICLATPVKAIVKLIEELAGLIHPTATVTDLGSTKAEVCSAARRFLPNNFVGSHPLAGSEKEGIEAATASLFQGAIWALTPLGEPDERAAQLKGFLESFGASVRYLEPQRHDRVVAYTSHLPQLLAVALAELVAERSLEDAHYQMLAARGFADMTRIAVSPFGIWQEICRSNARELDGALAALIERINAFKQVLGEGGSLRANFERAGAFRQVLEDLS